MIGEPDIQQGRQGFGIEFMFGNGIGRPRFNQAFSIRRLVIIGGNRQRHKNGGTADTGDFGHAGRPGPRDHQMRGGQTICDIAEEGRAIGLDAGVLVDVLSHCERFLAGLLGDFKAGFEPFREFCHRLRHCLGEYPGAQTAAEDKNPDRSGLVRERLVARRNKFGSDRIAGDEPLCRFGRSVQTLEARGDKARALGEDTIDTAQNGILLVNGKGQFFFAAPPSAPETPDSRQTRQPRPASRP